jgi:NADH:ubiquinone oxidoreductase subunit E
MVINPEIKREIASICKEHKDEPSPLLVVLEEIQSRFGYVSLEAMEQVSIGLGVPVAEIYGVVTFYNFFSLSPKGKYVVSVCLGTACYVKGGQAVCDKFEELLKVKPGQTTSDGIFTLQAIRCMGACALAPAVNINGKVYPQMTPDKVAGVLAEYQAKEAK